MIPLMVFLLGPVVSTRFAQPFVFVWELFEASIIVSPIEGKPTLLTHNLVFCSSLKMVKNKQLETTTKQQQLDPTARHERQKTMKGHQRDKNQRTDTPGSIAPNQRAPSSLGGGLERLARPELKPGAALVGPGCTWPALRNPRTYVDLPQKKTENPECGKVT